MLRALCVLIIGTLIISAILTPPIYSFCLYIGDGEVLWPFSRVLHRVAMAVTVILLFLMRKHFRLEELKNAFVRVPARNRWEDLQIGFLLALSSSLLVLWWCVYSGEFIPKASDLGYAVTRIGKALGSGIVVSLIEESFFRVILLSALVLRLGMAPGILICSMIYAGVHFISPAKDWEYPGMDFLVGFDYLMAVAARVVQLEIYAALFGLFLVGCVLAVVMLRFRSIYLCIGLHTGWVTAVKLAGYFTQPGRHYQEITGVGRRYFFVAQPESWLAVLLVGVLVWWLRAARSKTALEEKPHG